MDLVYMFSMFSAWGVKVNEETEVFTDLKTGKPANGRYCNNYPAFSVQYPPESSPGPHDSRYLFNEFKKLMTSYKKSNA